MLYGFPRRLVTGVDVTHRLADVLMAKGVLNCGSLLACLGEERLAEKLYRHSLAALPPERSHPHRPVPERSPREVLSQRGPTQIDCRLTCMCMYLRLGP